MTNRQMIKEFLNNKFNETLQERFASEEPSRSFAFNNINPFKPFVEKLPTFAAPPFQVNISVGEF